MFSTIEPLWFFMTKLICHYIMGLFPALELELACLLPCVVCICTYEYI